MISLSPQKEEEIIESARKELVQALITNHGKRVFLSKFEAGGILNWSPQTVMKHLTPYDTTENGGSVRFLLSDIEEEMKKRKIKI